MEESARLRHAIWDCGREFAESGQTMIRVDAALSVGLMASLRGFARPELTARGEWESSLERIAEDWARTLQVAAAPANFGE